jgi:capsid protein
MGILSSFKAFKERLRIAKMIQFKPSLESRGNVVIGGSSFSVEYLLGLDSQTLKYKALEIWWKSIHARGAIRQLNTLTVNTGLRLQSKPNRQILGITADASSQLAAEIEANFELIRHQKTMSYDGTKNLNELEMLARSSFDIFGEVFAILRYKNSINAINPVNVQIINPLQVKNPHDLHKYKNIIEDGIEYSKKKPIAIHVEVAGDVSGVGGSAVQTKFVRIPFIGPKSGKVFVIHNFLEEVPGQKRGIPKLAPVFHELERIQAGLKFEIESMATNSSIAVVIEREKAVVDADKLKAIMGGTGSTSNEVPTPPGTRVKSEVVTTDKGGFVIQNGEPGETFKSFDTKRPNVDIPEFIRKEIDWIGPAIGLPSEIWLMLFSNNYSASRGTLELGWRGFDASNYHFSVNFEQIIFEAVIDAEIAAGHLVLPGWTDKRLRAAYVQTKWLGIPLPSLNPLQEAKASTERIKNYTSTIENEAQRNAGMSFDDNADRQERERLRVAEIADAVGEVLGDDEINGEAVDPDVENFDPDK